MHFLLYVCLPREEASTSLRARRKVCQYLSQQGFAMGLRFAGRCDYFCVGGRYSGQLAWLRLRADQPNRVAQFWKRCARFRRKTKERKSAELFRRMFPEYHGPPLLGRELDFYGGADDAQILDQQLFRLLRNGFNLEVTFAGDGETPNVIFTAPHEEDYEWPTTVEEAANFWVVVIDYHD